MTREIIVQRITDALHLLYDREFILIKNKTHEETIATHLAGYLKAAFIPDGWDVDAGYNRDGVDPKKDQDGNLILPDIIIHHRLSSPPRFSPENNLVAIEIKGNWNPEKRTVDAQKLRDLGRRYGYQYIFQIELGERSGQIAEAY
jgi:hypothetical protein